METVGESLLTDEQWGNEVLLPHRPFATNQLEHGQYRMSRDQALMMRYIQHSPHALLGSIVIDCDHPDAAMRASRNRRIIRRRAGSRSLPPGGRTWVGGWAIIESAVPTRRG